MAKASSRKTFEVLLTSRGNGVAFIVPFSVQEVFGKKGGVRVRGTIDGCAYRSSVFPLGDGTHYMVVKKPIRDSIRKLAGDRVSVVMEVDIEERIVTVPDDFKQALDQNPPVKAIFDKLAYSHRKEYVEWIENAKWPETRAKRMAKAIEQIPTPGGSDFL